VLQNTRSRAPLINSTQITIQKLLSEGSSLLASNGIDTAALDAALLLSEVTGLSREKLYTHPDHPVGEEQRKRYFEFLARRQNGECTAYILGRKEFWGLDFAVTPAVLVPRPDTEILVEAALCLLCPPAAVLDLCTGSGAAAIALKKQCPALDVWASDISQNALEIARINAQRLGCAITFIQSDLFEAFNNSAEPMPRFRLISANAPYIASAHIETLAAEVRQEPCLALDGGSDGLDIIRRIIREAPPYLEAGGSLVLEADPSQMEIIALLMKERGFREPELFRDLSGQNRVIAGSL